MRKFLIFAASILILFSGCAPKGYTQADVGEVMVNYKGTVTATKTVDISDDGGGMIIGAIVGAVLGHQIGEGRGKDLATVAGAVAGGAAGSALNKDRGQEVTIDLDNGQKITTLIRLDKKSPYWLKKGDRVMIYLRGDKIVKVVPIFNETVKESR